MTRRAFAFATLLAACTPTKGQAPPQRQSDKRVEPVRRVELVRLVRPIDGGPRARRTPTTDFALLTVQFPSLTAFLPRDAPDRELMLDENPVEFLVSPLENRTAQLIAPMPQGGLAQATVWFLPPGKTTDKMSPDEIKALLQRHKSQAGARTIQVAPAFREKRAFLQVRVFPTRAELARYARQLGEGGGQ